MPVCASVIVVVASKESPRSTSSTSMTETPSAVRISIV
jgi:hypothetical protein